MTGTQLRALRRRADLSGPQFANQLGVHPNTVYRWERGERGIPEPVARLARRILEDPAPPP